MTNDPDNADEAEEALKAVQLMQIRLIMDSVGHADGSPVPWPNKNWASRHKTDAVLSTTSEELSKRHSMDESATEIQRESEALMDKLWDVFDGVPAARVLNVIATFAAAVIQLNAPDAQAREATAGAVETIMRERLHTPLYVRREVIDETN